MMFKILGKVAIILLICFSFNISVSQAFLDEVPIGEAQTDSEKLDMRRDLSTVELKSLIEDARSSSMLSDMETVLRRVQTQPQRGRLHSFLMGTIFMALFNQSSLQNYLTSAISSFMEAVGVTFDLPQNPGSEISGTPNVTSVLAQEIALYDSVVLATPPSDSGQSDASDTSSTYTPDAPDSNTQPDQQPSSGQPVTSPTSGMEFDTSGFTRIRRQSPTYYMTAMEEGFPVSGRLFGTVYNGTERRVVRKPDGSAIASTSGRFYAQLRMQGSGILLRDIGVSYVSNSRFNRMAEGCYGITATGNWVLPFHTMAVNPSLMPYRGVYYIPGTRGLTLPNGEVHDGFWFAHDTGGAFLNTSGRIDLYVKKTDWVSWMEHNFAESHSSIDVYRVDDRTRNQVTERYRPLFQGR